MSPQLLANIVSEIDCRDEDDEELLLATFLSAAWPSFRGQSQ